MVIDSDSDDGYLCKQKRAKIAEMHIKGKYTTNLEKVQPHHAQSSQDESQQMFYSESFRSECHCFFVLCAGRGYGWVPRTAWSIS